MRAHLLPPPHFLLFPYPRPGASLPGMSEPAAISDFMTELPATIEVGMKLGDALDRMYQDNIRHLPVVDGDAVAGVVSIRDVLAAHSG